MKYETHTSKEEKIREEENLPIDREVERANLPSQSQLHKQWLAFLSEATHVDEEGMPWIVVNFVEDKLIEQMDIYLNKMSLALTEQKKKIREMVERNKLASTNKLAKITNL